MIKDKILNNVQYIKVGTAGVLSVFITKNIFAVYNIQSHPLLFWLILFAVGVLLYRAIKIKKRSIVLAAAVFSFLLAVSQVVGRKICFAYSEFYDFSIRDYLYSIPALALFYYSTSALLLDTVIRHSIKTQCRLNKPKASSNLRFWFGTSLLIALCWFPALLFYFPGCLSGDSFASLCRALGIAPVSDQQPVLFQLILIPFVNIGRLTGSINKGVAIYSLVQLLLMAAAVSYALTWLRKQGFPSVAILLAGLYFILNPVFAVYSITMWKDILFGGMMLVYVIFLFNIVDSRGKSIESKKNLLFFLGVSFLLAFFRNTGVYIILSVFIATSLYLKACRKRLIPAFLSVLLLIAIIQGPIYRAFQIKSSPFAEAVGIPLQQIGRTLAQNGTVSDRQLEQIDQIMPAERIKTVYWPFSVDNIKFDRKFNNINLEKNKTEFLKTWLELFVPNSKEYFKAYAMETYGYWYIGIQNWILFDGVKGYGGQTYGVVSRNLFTEWTGHDLRHKMWDYFKRLNHFPLTAPLFSIGFLFWMFLFCAVILFIRHQKRYLLPLLPLAVLWLTLMAAAPTYCEFRYMFSFALAVPFIFLFCLKGPSDSKTAIKSPTKPS